MGQRKILISGGGGLIGRGVSNLLLKKGFTVVHLSRKENLNAEMPSYRWDIEKKFLDPRALHGITDVIHLAGAGIADQNWTAQRKQELIDSRVKSAELIFNSIQSEGIQLHSLIGASAVGFYGASTSDKIYAEKDPPASDFLGTCCKMWEKSYEAFNNSGIRTVIFRIGIVISRHGGALAKLAAPVCFGAGAALGSGKQYVPWIHEKDLHRLFLSAIESQEMSGIYNAVATEHCTNSQLTKAIAKTLHRPLLLPNVPGFVLRLTLGERADMILEGSRVSNNRLLSSGFQFEFPEILPALMDSLKE